jgi:hypothetical protein
MPSGMASNSKQLIARLTVVSYDLHRLNIALIAPE